MQKIALSCEPKASKVHSARVEWAQIAAGCFIRRAQASSLDCEAIRSNRSRILPASGPCGNRTRGLVHCRAYFLNGRKARGCEATAFSQGFFSEGKKGFAKDASYHWTKGPLGISWRVINKNSKQAAPLKNNRLEWNAASRRLGNDRLWGMR